MYLGQVNKIVYFYCAVHISWRAEVCPFLGEHTLKKAICVLSYVLRPRTNMHSTIVKVTLLNPDFFFF